MKVFEEKKGNIHKLLSEAISEGIIIVNEKQEIVASNKMANKIFGYTDEELLGESLNVLIPREYHQSHPTQVKKFINEDEQRQMGHGRDLYGLRKDGSKFPVEAGLNPFMIYDKPYVMALVSDITIRKTQENQIRELNVSLEKNISERTKELNKTITELKKEVSKRKEA